MSSSPKTARKVAIVTGAAGGIGKFVALRLLKDGFNVIISDLSTQKENLDGVLKESEEIESRNGGKCVAVVCDVAQEDQVQAMVDRALEAFGRLDVMIANAGIFAMHSLAEVPIDTFRRIMDVNAIGTLLCFRVAAAAMIKQGTAKGGRLIAACSAAAKQGFPYHGAYCASKFAVRALVHTAAKEYAEDGITVNAYAPGIIDTPITRGVTSQLITGMTGEQFQQMGASKNLMKRVGQPEEVAGLVSFLVSEESSFMTGQTISFDGGVIFE